MKYLLPLLLLLAVPAGAGTMCPNNNCVMPRQEIEQRLGRWDERPVGVSDQDVKVERLLKEIIERLDQLKPEVIVCVNRNVPKNFQLKGGQTVVVDCDNDPMYRDWEQVGPKLKFPLELK